MALATNLFYKNKQDLCSFKIDGKWDTFDLYVLIESMEYLYYERFSSMKYSELSDELKMEIEEISKDFEKDLKWSLLEFDNRYHNYGVEISPSPILGTHKFSINIHSIKYGSPGSFNFQGLGEIFKQIKDTVIHFFPREKQNLEIEIIHQNVVKLKIENLKSIGFSNEEIQELILKENRHIQRLGKLIGDGKIKSIDIIKPDQELGKN